MRTPNVRMVSCAMLMVAWLCLFPGILWSQGPGDQPLTAASTPAFGNCPPPTTAGVRLCQPLSFSGVTSIASPFQLIASGTGAGGSVKSMQVWVDRVKIKQANGNLFDAPVTLSPGTHRLVVVELDSAGGHLASTPVTVSVEGSTADEGCAPPASPGVNVCIPAAIDSCHTSPWTTIVASGTGASGSVQRMELWNSGVKLANFAGNKINTNLYLNDFSTVTIVEVDSAGAIIKSARIVLQSC